MPPTVIGIVSEIFITWGKEHGVVPAPGGSPDRCNVAAGSLTPIQVYLHTDIRLTHI